MKIQYTLSTCYTAFYSYLKNQLQYNLNCFPKLTHYLQNNLLKAQLYLNPPLENFSGSPLLIKIKLNPIQALFGHHHFADCQGEQRLSYWTPSMLTRETRGAVPTRSPSPTALSAGHSFVLGSGFDLNRYKGY